MSEKVDAHQVLMFINKLYTGEWRGAPGVLLPNRCARVFIVCRPDKAAV